MSKDGQICSVADLVKVLRESNHLKAEHAHIRYWFRGQACRKWDLRPAVYRQEFSKKIKSGSGQEEERIRMEQHLLQDFTAISAGLRTDISEPTDVYVLAQHYGLPTRLLDWSNNCLAALYFAAISRDESDGALFMIDAYSLSERQKAEGFKGIATLRSTAFKNAIEVYSKWLSYDKLPNSIIPVRPNYIDRRMTLQRSCFTFHVPGKEALTSEHAILKKFIVPSDAKATICDELTMLGIDAFAIFGDMPHLTDTLKRAYRV